MDNPNNSGIVEVVLGVIVALTTIIGAAVGQERRLNKRFSETKKQFDDKIDSVKDENDLKYARKEQLLDLQHNSDNNFSLLNQQLNYCNKRLDEIIIILIESNKGAGEQLRNINDDQRPSFKANSDDFKR